jgi:hypothetical protein
VGRLVRPLEFIAFSVPLFLAWMFVLRQPYLTLLAHVFAVSARIFGHDVQVTSVHDGDIRFEYRDVAWVDKFGLTGVNVVALAALVLATQMAWPRRLRMAAAGIGLLFLTQIAGLWTDIVHVHLHADPATEAFANGLRAFMTGFGTFFFPLLVWLWLVRDRLPLVVATRR